MMKRIFVPLIVLLAVVALSAGLASPVAAVPPPPGCYPTDNSSNGKTLTGFGPSTVTLTSSDSSGDTVTYVVQVTCLFKHAGEGDSGEGVFSVTATCSGPNCEELYAAIAYTGIPTPNCNQSGGTCTGVTGQVIGETSYHYFEVNGEPYTYFDGSATVSGFPPHGNNVVAQLGTVTFLVPNFNGVSTSLSLAFSSK
jgi:hypothetical protein